MPSALATMLTVDALHCGYGRIAVIKGVSLEVKRGEIVALIGSNGAGKTTLLRTLSGVHPLSSGSISLDGESVAGLTPHRRVALGMIQVPEGRQVFPALSVEDNLRLGAFRRGRSQSAERLAQMFELFPALADKRRQPAGNLSGGQQQMLALGRALMAKPSLLLLDEPSMGLAPLIADQIFATIAQIKRDGVTILLVEQNAERAIEIADRGYVLETGTIALSGTAATLRSNPQVQAAYLGT
jgi:branched-chain amino acid transport system ATP-binding protein